MADSVRSDLVTVKVKGVRVFDAFANLLGRAAEADAGIAPPLMRPFIDVAAAVGDEIAPADEEGEVKPVATCSARQQSREFLPALELGAIVERHDDELRRAIDARLHRRNGAKGRERRQCGDESSGGQFSPPTESDSDSVLVYQISGSN